MVRPAEYLLCGGVTVIDNNFQTVFFCLLFVFLSLFSYDSCLRKRRYGQTCRVSVVWSCGRHRQQCGRRHTPMDCFVTMMTIRMMRMMMVTIMRL